MTTSYTNLGGIAVATVDDRKALVRSQRVEKIEYNDLFKLVLSETALNSDPDKRVHNWVKVRLNEPASYKRLYNAMLVRAKRGGWKLSVRTRDGYSHYRLHRPKEK